MKNEIEFFSIKQEDAFNSMSEKIVNTYNSLGYKLPAYKTFTKQSGLHQLLNKVYTIIFHRGDPLSVPVFLNRVAKGKIKGLGKPNGEAFARLEDTFLGFGHFRNDGKAITLKYDELKALQIYMRQSNQDIATTQFKYKDLVISAILFRSCECW